MHSTVHGTYSCHVTGDLDECEGRYRKLSSLRGMKQEMIFLLEDRDICYKCCGFWTRFESKDAPVLVCGVTH